VNASESQAARGRWNSSLTRIRPVFAPLLARKPSEPWLRALLEVCPNIGRLPPAVSAAPGELRPELAHRRPYDDTILGPIELEAAFEHPVPPTERFLRYLLTHPDKLCWPRVKGERRTYSDATMRRRGALFDGPEETRARVIDEALGELDRLGVTHARTKPWWSFEGYTEVDCFLETERLVLFIEGKRKEALSESTSWFPGRNQLVRNLEAIGEVAQGRACGVLLVTQESVAELDDEVYERSLPHLLPPERDDVRQRYLGQTTWEKICEAVGVPVASLPDERPTA
jgi:hypothetical protein